MARLRGKRWTADVRLENGERLRPSFDTEEQALAWEAAARLAKVEGKPIPSPQTVSKKGGGAHKLNLLGALYDHVVRTVWSHGRAGSTQIKNGQHVVEYFGRNKNIAEITSVDIAEMRVAFMEKGNAPATANRKAAALSKMLRTAHDSGLLDRMPKFNWSPEGKTKFRYLDDKEEQILLEYWDTMELEDMRDLTVLLIDTGGRCFSEVVPLRWDALGPDFKTVTFWQTKTNKPRTVPLTQRSQAILKKRHVTRNQRYGPFASFKKRATRDRWDAMRVALGFQDVTPHTLRHTCCTRLVLGGVDVKRVMTWMGHSNIATTMRYMQIKPTALEDIVGVLER